MEGSHILGPESHSCYTDEGEGSPLNGYPSHRLNGYDNYRPIRDELDGCRFDMREQDSSSEEQPEAQPEAQPEDSSSEEGPEEGESPLWV